MSLLVVMQYWQKYFFTFAAPPALVANQEDFWSNGQYTLNGFQLGNMQFILSDFSVDASSIA